MLVGEDLDGKWGYSGTIGSQCIEGFGVMDVGALTAINPVHSPLDGIEKVFLNDTAYISCTSSSNVRRDIPESATSLERSETGIHVCKNESVILPPTSFSSLQVVFLFRR